MSLSLEEIVEKIITTVEQVNIVRLEKAIKGPNWFSSEYGNRLVDLLSNDAKYNEFSNHIQYLGQAGSQTGIKNLADWIVERAYTVGSRQSIKDLDDYLNSEEVEVYVLSLLTSIYFKSNDTKEYTFCNNVKLINAELIPNKTVSSNIIHNLHNSILPFPRVKTALIKIFKQKKQHESCNSSSLQSVNIESPTIDLEETRLCIILARQLAGAHTIATGVIAPDNLPFIQSFSGWSIKSFKQPTTFGSILDVELKFANTLLCKFITLEREFKDKLIVSIENFNGYASLSTKVERAISLRTCLESIFLDDGNKEQLGYRLGLRGALLLGTNIEEKKRIMKILRDTYSITSSAVHEGKISDRNMKKIKVLDDSANLAKKAIIKLINEGKVNWEDLELN